MNLRNKYWFFESVLTPRLCDQIINYAQSKKDQFARVGEYTKKEISKSDIKNIKKKRNSNIVWLNELWIYKEIKPYIDIANKNAGWNFDWDYSEDFQFTKYEKNQYYHWHNDCFDEPFNNPDDLKRHKKIRKLSVTCSLSDPSEYKGGELEFNFNDLNYGEKENIKICNEIKPRGSIVVFPSFLWHRVKPVKKGIRYSLVLWNLGYPFR